MCPCTAIQASLEALVVEAVGAAVVVEVAVAAAVVVVEEVDAAAVVVDVEEEEEAVVANRIYRPHLAVGVGVFFVKLTLV